MKKILIIIPLIILLHSCDFWVPIELKNDSKESVYFNVGFVGTGGSQYPDTLVPNIRIRFPIKPKSVSSLDFDGWDIKRHIFGDRDTLSMFIISCDTVAKYGSEDVRANYRILRRYDVSVADVESLNGTLVYPPTPEMSHIKMWPPYGK